MSTDSYCKCSGLSVREPFEASSSTRCSRPPYFIRASQAIYVGGLLYAAQQPLMRSLLIHKSLDVALTPASCAWLEHSRKLSCRLAPKTWAIYNIVRPCVSPLWTRDNIKLYPASQIQGELYRNHICNKLKQGTQYFWSSVSSIPGNIWTYGEIKRACNWTGNAPTVQVYIHFHFAGQGSMANELIYNERMIIRYKHTCLLTQTTILSLTITALRFHPHVESDVGKWASLIHIRVQIYKSTGMFCCIGMVGSRKMADLSNSSTNSDQMDR